MLLAATVLQAAVSYCQYLTGLPAGLIEIHIVGAGILVITAVHFSLVLGSYTMQLRAGTPVHHRRDERPAGSPSSSIQ